jgi:hypothetical protein
MPLTGICTPLPKQDSRFRFPSNVNEKVQEYENTLIIGALSNAVNCGISVSRWFL